ncbi:SMI1/KNR4 family protein [Pseudothauera rhizosphaerae]|uniref:SMI1/KNR4 family protein n=1 Tax=Pseudothauera rhizosphaerae TaxID=2565932 RepID=A0A4S4AMC8_9RHOO|nr:SMI1/KNR4 family protein [Pseudothauera rhizosphaerae]THF59461.1 SMI1/KNR4 family protein [Pseudothauera rhizosphaerae]
MYEFMRHLKRDPESNKIIGLHENFFLPVGLSEINEAENSLNIAFPAELRQFYMEVGWGQLQTGNSGAVADYNYIASPREIVAIIDGASEWLMPYSQIEAQTLPFLQRDVDLFLCLHPNSDNPNAVYWMWGEKMSNGGRICDSLVGFFRRLVDDPNWFNLPNP